jgi:hypothetical protein
MDSLPPEPPPPHYAYAPGDIYPVGAHEQELCDAADHPDWLYLGGLLVLDVGAVYVNSFVFKFADEPWQRQLGPAAIGLSWGATLGGGYLALPKCEPHWVPTAPREGEVRAHWPLALSLALASAISAPVIMGVATGPLPTNWTTEERASRLLITGGFAFAGALLPYVLPPRTWRAARELERIRLSGDSRGTFVSYGFAF